MSNAASKLHNLFKANKESFTLASIKKVYPDLKPSQISMALCYLMKQRYLSRVAIQSNLVKGRKEVWQYSYHPEKLPKVENEDRTNQG
jgi:hypothetical protein